MKTRGRSTVGPLLRWPGSVLATLDALAVATARFTSLINSAMLQDLVIASAALLGFLFLWMLFDPGVRFAIDAANAEMKGGNSNAAYFRWRPGIRNTRNPIQDIRTRYSIIIEVFTRNQKKDSLLTGSMSREM